jgi:hypothetical protein
MVVYFEVLLQLVLQMKKIFSEGTDVTGTANTRFAITDNRGYLVVCSKLLEIKSVRYNASATNQRYGIILCDR